MYNKLFTKILDSTIWLEPTSTRIVWITLLAAMDETGYAHFSAIGNLAGRARVSLEEAEEAVRVFTSPDPHAPEQEHEGKRVERVPGGFIILNAPKYRSMMNRADQKEKTRERVAEWRARHPKKSYKRSKPTTGEQAALRALERGDERGYDNISSELKETYKQS